MPKQERFKTQYPGVYYIVGQAVATGKPEKVFYIMYRKGGKLIEEKAGRQFQNDMTAAKAARMRAQRIEGDELPNTERRAEEEARKAAEAGKWTMAKIWEEYKTQKQPRGIVQDECRWRLYLAPSFGEKEPCEIITLDVDRLRVSLSQKHDKSPQTVKHVVALLRRLVRFAVDKGLCPPPLPGKLKFELPKVQNEKTEILTPEEIANLLEAIETDPNIQAANVMKMALFTGLRRSECFKLKWSDIDWQSGFITLTDTKSGRVHRVPMNELARQLLESHPKTGSEYVFPGRGGQQRQDIHHQTRRIMRRAGLPEDFRSLHGLRHVFATLLASSGKVTLYELQKLLTHASPVVTQRYAHLVDSALHRASDVGAEIIGAISARQKEAAEAEARGKVVGLADAKVVKTRKKR